MRRSAVRDLLRVAGRPGMISMAGGLPAPEGFPVEAVRGAVDRILRERPSAALQYGETEGVPGLRAWIAGRASTPGCRWSAENVLVTSGAQQALDLVGRVLLDDGDRARVPNPTYLALLSAWRPLGVRFSAWDPGVPPSGEAGRVWYAVPNFANPTGRTLSLREREWLLAAAGREGAVVLEDDPYGELRYEGEPLPGLLELGGKASGVEAGAGSGGDRGVRVLRSGSFSKVLAPGLRVGWLLGPAAAIRRLALAKQAMDLHTSSLGQAVVLALAEEGELDRLRPAWLARYRERRDALLGALEAWMPAGVRWTRPEGGMFVWVTLPEDLDAGTLLGRALEAGVAYVPGGEFHLGADAGEGRSTLRLNFTHAGPEALREGVRRLAGVLRAGLVGRPVQAVAGGAGG